MKVIGINGSPRKGWNTDLLVSEALKGAASKGAETELIHLYDLRFRGCISCFGCKKKDSPGVGRCAFSDELLPVLDKIHHCGGLVLGTPIYIGDVSSSMRALIERLTFQYISYQKEKGAYFDRKMPVLSIYTMNCPEEAMKNNGYESMFARSGELYNRLLGGPSKSLAVNETLQADDYSKYEMSRFDEAARKKRRDDVFSQELKKAFDLGAEMFKIA